MTKVEIFNSFDQGNRAEVLAMQKEKTDLVDQLFVLRKEVKELNQEKSAIKENVSLFKEELQKLQGGLTSVVIGEKNVFDEKRGQINLLDSKLAVLDKEISIKSQQLEKIVLSIGTKLQEESKVLQHYDQMGIERTELINKLFKEIDTLNKTIAGLQEINKTLLKEKKELENEIAVKREEINEELRALEIKKHDIKIYEERVRIRFEEMFPGSVMKFLS